MSAKVLQFGDSEPHCKTAYLYARDVLTGKIPACKETKQAARRFVDDLARAETGEFPYRFDVTAAEKVCKFLGKLPHVKGKWAARREFLVLSSWQCFLMCNIFGWLHKETGKRRFREAYLRVSRKNGKSLLAAGIGLYMLCHDGEVGAEVYAGATTEKQAWEVFRPARQICLKEPDLVSAFDIEVNASNLLRWADQSRFEPVIGNPGDGPSPSCAIADEYHEHDRDDQVETMRTGMMAREQPLLLVITTAGNSLGGPCYLAELEYRRILRGDYADDRIFVLIYGVDDEAEWQTEAGLQKANPNLDVSVDGGALRAEQQRAIRDASKENAFKRKHCGVWTGAKTGWLPMEKWHACADPALTIDDVAQESERCVFPVDLASKSDICASYRMFRRTIEGKVHYYVFCNHYLPEEVILGAEERNAHYQRWHNKGLITLTEGDEIDFEAVQSDLEVDMKTYGPDEIPHDPWRATQMMQELGKKGAVCVEIPQSVKYLSPAMDEMEAAVKAGRFHHTGDECLTWMVGNVICKVDKKDNKFPDKERPDNKIDGAVACIMGVGRLMLLGERPTLDIVFA